MLDQRRVDLGPGGLEGRHAVRRDGHLAVLDADDVGRLGGGREAGAALLVHGVVELHIVAGGGIGGFYRGGRVDVGRGGVEDVFILSVVKRDVGGGVLLGRSLEGCWGGHVGSVYDVLCV